MLETMTFWNVTNVMASTIEIVVFKEIISEFSEFKGNKLKLYLMMICTILVISILVTIGLDIYIKMIIAISMFTFIYKINYIDKLQRMIIIIALYFLLIIGIDGISMSLVSVMNGIESIQMLSNNIYRLEFIIIAKTLLIFMVPIIKKRKIVLNISLKEFMFIMIPIIANSLSILLMFSFEFEWIQIYEFKDIIILGFTALILISNVFLIYNTEKIIKEAELRNENNMIKQKIDSQYKHYIELESAQLKVRKLYHDMNNHLICIERLNNLNEGSKEYLDSIKQELNKWESIKTTGNMIVDIILNEKKEICEKESIRFEAKVNFREDEMIDMIDICAIFSNVLDNAIEASLKIEEKENRNISIVGNTVNNFFVLRCENSKKNIIIKKKRKIFTDKRDTYLHGLGINSIKNSVEKYKGTVAIDYTEDEFIVNIYIPLNKVKKGNFN